MLPLRVRVLPLRLRKLWLGVLPLWVLLRLRKLRLLAIEVARVTAPVLEVNGTAVWGSRSPGPRQHGRQHKEPHTTIKKFYLEHRRDGAGAGEEPEWKPEQKLEREPEREQERSRSLSESLSESRSMSRTRTQTRCRSRSPSRSPSRSRS